MLVPSTLRDASPVVGKPARVRSTFFDPFLSVAPPTRNTALSLSAVCTHTPSGSVSPGCTAYAKVSVGVPEPDT